MLKWTGEPMVAETSEPCACPLLLPALTVPGFGPVPAQCHLQRISSDPRIEEARCLGLPERCPRSEERRAFLAKWHYRRRGAELDARRRLAGMREAGR